MLFKKPIIFNGENFKKELLENQIEIINFIDDGQGNLLIFSDDKNKTKIENVLNNHNGDDSIIIDNRQNAINKLIQLGLTPEEIAAL